MTRTRDTREGMRRTRARERACGARGGGGARELTRVRRERRVRMRRENECIDEARARKSITVCEERERRGSTRRGGEGEERRHWKIGNMGGVFIALGIK